MIAAVPTVASVESLRCNGQSVSEGDTRLALRYNCGEPLLADTYCAPVYYAPTFRPVPEPFASIVVPCQLVEEWLYDGVLDPFWPWLGSAQASCSRFAVAVRHRAANEAPKRVADHASKPARLCR